MGYNQDRRRLTEVSYPANPDDWSKSLTPSEGYWTRGGFPGGGDVYLDNINKVVGDTSIRCDSSLDGAISCIFILYDGKEFNAVGKNAKLEFFHALDIKQTGNCAIKLSDMNGRGAYREFGTPPISLWEKKEWGVGTDTGWTLDAGFDWTKIKSIQFWSWFHDFGGSFWVDEPHFSYEAPDGILRVQSSPTGKSGTMAYLGETYSFITTSEVTLPVGTEVTVAINPTDFLRWDDGNTNPTRTETIQAGLKTITATYTTVVPPLIRLKCAGPQTAPCVIRRGEYTQTIEINTLGATIRPTPYDGWYFHAVDIAGFNFQKWQRDDEQEWLTPEIGPFTFAPATETNFTAYYTTIEPKPKINMLPLLGIGLVGILIYSLYKIG